MATKSVTINPATGDVINDEVVNFPTGTITVDGAAIPDAVDILTKSGNLSGLASASTARTNIGLGSVDDTADSAKPASSPQKLALMRNVATIAALRALTDYSDGQRVSVSGYYAGDDGSGLPPYRFDEDSTADDDGGFTIKPTSISSGPGRWKLWTDPDWIDAGWFGIKNVITPTADVLSRLQAAHDALPIIYGSGSGPGGAYVTPSGRLFRQGRLHFPRGRFYLGGTFYRCPQVSLIGEGAMDNGTILQLINNTFTNAGSPQFLIAVDVGLGGSTGGGDVSGNNCFFNHMEGFLMVGGAASGGNVGVKGFEQFTAQGTVIRDLALLDFGPLGISTSGYISNLWVANTISGPGLIFRGGVITRASIEHCNTGEATDGLGLLPQVLINSSDEVSIGTLQGELDSSNANGTMLRINDAWHGANIDNVYWGGTAAGTAITVDIVGQSRRVTIGAMDYAGSAGTLIQLRDRSDNSPLGSGVPFTLTSGTVGYSQVWPRIEDVATKAPIESPSFTGSATFTNSGLNEYLNVIDVFGPSNTTSGNNTMFRIGVAVSTKNCGDLRFKYIGDNNDSNELGIGFSGVVTAVLRLLASGDTILKRALRLGPEDDSLAPNDTLYYSTTQSAICYKTSGGTVIKWFDGNYSSLTNTPKTSPVAIVTESTTARTLGLSDIGKYIRLTNSSSCTITLPVNASVDWAAQSYPSRIEFRVAAAGIPTLSASGVTVNDPQSIIAGLATGDTFRLQWIASDVWDVI